ncbi:MAG: ABC transporter permease [Desulfohalobiaceae bacterium]
MSGSRRRDRGGGAMRLRGLIRKEFFQVVRDPSSLAIAFVMPVVLLLLFGYGVSLDAEHVPLALVAEDPGPDSADLFSAFSGSSYFEARRFPSFAAAGQALLQGEVRGILRLQGDFSRRLRTGGSAPVQLVVDGVDANTARIVMGYADGVIAAWQEGRGVKNSPAGAVELEQRVWFNAEVRSRNYLVPGLVAVIMTLIGALLTAMVMAREWERGTMEALMVTPVSVREILIGKLVPYFVLGMGGMALSVAMAIWVFEVPLRGSFWVLLVCSVLFLLVALGMGLLISILSKDQFVAGQAAILSTFLPAFLLSGFIFEIPSMPGWVQAITYLIGARYFVAILQTVFLAGDLWSIIIPNALALIGLAAVFLGISRAKARKRLE